MKKTTILSITCGVMMCLQSSAQLPQTLTNRLSEVLDSVCLRYKIKGASAAVHFPNAGTWKRGYGYSQQNIPITPDMYFGMGSNTKTHIAALLLNMQENGLLNLNDTIGKWIQGYPNINGQITIRQCLNHTSGLHDYMQSNAINDSIFGKPAKIWTREEIIRVAETPNFPPGSAWDYSNTNYIVTGIIISKVLNQSPWAALNTRLLAPHGLNHTKNFGDAGATPLAHPWSTILTGSEMEDMTQTPYLDNLFSLANTAGSLVTTAEDNVLFWHLLTSGKLLNSTSWGEMTQTINIGGGDGYGLGIFKYNNELNGRGAYSHGGTFFGYINENAVDIASGITFSVLTNQDSLSNNLLFGAVIKALHKVSLQIPAGTTRVNRNPFVQLYPNPASDHIRIQYSEDISLAKAEIVDITGRALQSEILPSNVSAYEFALKQKAGIYLLQLFDKDNNLLNVERIIIK